MKVSRVVRSGNLVGVGQAGIPPEGLRTFETVDGDPSGVLARPAGSVVHLRNGTGAWLNVDGTVAGWRSFASLGIAVDAVENGGWAILGADATSFDISSLDCDTDGGFLLMVQGFSVGAATGVIRARVNASTASLVRSGNYALTDASAPNNYFGDLFPDLGQYNTVGGAAGCPWTVLMDCPIARSGTYRTIRTETQLMSDPTLSVWWPNWQRKTWRSVAPITDIGIESTIANDIAAATRYRLWRYPPL